ncbi:MAG: hypothetical protein AB8G16_04210 [Gammaproteobacteria bacterium]
MEFLKPLALILVLSCMAPAEALSVDTVEYASVRNDLDGLVALRSELTANTASYNAAFLEFRIGVAANANGEGKIAKKSLKNSAKILKKALKESPDSVPHMALLANVYGMQIGVSPMKGPLLGGKAQRLAERATQLEPGNAQTMLIRGISSFNTPSMWGGSKKDALKWLDQAITAFERGATTGWGAAEAHVWRALTLDALERRAEAIDALNVALSVEPDYVWARFILSTLQEQG